MGDFPTYFCVSLPRKHAPRAEKRPRDEGEDYDAHRRKESLKHFNENIIRELQEKEHVLPRVAQSRPRSVVGEEDIQRYGLAYEISKAKEYLNHQDVKRSKIEQKESELRMLQEEAYIMLWEQEENLRVMKEKARHIDEELEMLEDERAWNVQRFDVAYSKLDELRYGPRL